MFVSFHANTCCLAPSKLIWGLNEWQFYVSWPDDGATWKVRGSPRWQRSNLGYLPSVLYNVRKWWWRNVNLTTNLILTLQRKSPSIYLISRYFGQTDKHCLLLWLNQFQQTAAKADKVCIVPLRFSAWCWYLDRTPLWRMDEIIPIHGLNCSLLKLGWEGTMVLYESLQWNPKQALILQPFPFPVN